MPSALSSASELGSQKVAVTELTGVSAEEFEQLYSKTGISHVFKAGATQSVVDMAVASIAKLTKSLSDFDVNSVNTLIHCTQTPTGYLPGDGFRVQAAAGLGKGCTVIDINNGCAGFVLSLYLALASKDVFGNTLITTSDAYSTVMRDDSRATQAIFSDGASATCLSTETLRSSKILGFDCFSDGESRSALEVNSSSGELFMNGPAVYLFTQSVVAKSVQNTLDAASVTLDSVDKIFFHQPSRLVLEGLMADMELTRDKVVGIESDNLINATSSSIPFLLDNWGPIQKGEVVLFCGFGVGLTCATLLVEF